MDNYVKLDCGHCFNYDCLFNNNKSEKNKYIGNTKNLIAD